jgi:hypothetical protein
MVLLMLVSGCGDAERGAPESRTTRRGRQPPHAHVGIRHRLARPVLLRRAKGSPCIFGPLRREGVIAGAHEKSRLQQSGDKATDHGLRLMGPFIIRRGAFTD